MKLLFTVTCALGMGTKYESVNQREPLAISAVDFNASLRECLIFYTNEYHVLHFGQNC